MARFKLRIAGADSNDPAEYDRLCALAKRTGFQAIACGCLAELTDEQMVDKNDPWLSFPVMNSGIFKVVETQLVNGIFSKAHMEKNAALLKEKSKILARHGMKGVSSFLEPQFLPESFYAKHPHLRGARCDNPCLSLSNYYSPCLDQPEILDHYREAVRKLLEIAPELMALSFWTNDSGAGICWCTGLYPGPNGPRFCKDVSMGKRIEGWMKACLAGARDAGHQIEMIFTPVHFGRAEKYDTIDNLPRGAHIAVDYGQDAGGAPNIPFFGKESRELITACRKRRRPAVVGLDPAQSGWLMAPVMQMPIPYYGLEAMREAYSAGAEIVSVGGLAAAEYGVESVPTMVILEGLKRPLKSALDADRIVAKIAKAHVGARLAPALVTAWRHVDYATRICPHNADTNHMLYPAYSLHGGRWLVRPIVPAPKLLTAQERAYYEDEFQQSLSEEKKLSFFIGEGQMNYKLDEFKWLVALLEEMMQYLDRAVSALEAAMSLAGEGGEKDRFILQYRRVRALRAVWRTMKNVYLCGSIVEYFSGPRKDEYWNVIRRDESFKMPATYRRLFLEGVDDEITNCREIAALLAEPGPGVIATTEMGSTWTYGPDLPALLEKKISIMEAHKKNIDVLFPNCPPETFTDPTYEWADKRRGQDASWRN